MSVSTLDITRQTFAEEPNDQALFNRHCLVCVSIDEGVDPELENILKQHKHLFVVRNNDWNASKQIIANSVSYKVLVISSDKLDVDFINSIKYPKYIIQTNGSYSEDVALAAEMKKITLIRSSNGKMSPEELRDILDKDFDEYKNPANLSPVLTWEWFNVSEGILNPHFHETPNTPASICVALFEKNPEIKKELDGDHRFLFIPKKDLKSSHQVLAEGATYKALVLPSGMLDVDFIKGLNSIELIIQTNGICKKSVRAAAKEKGITLVSFGNAKMSPEKILKELNEYFFRSATNEHSDNFDLFIQQGEELSQKSQSSKILSLPQGMPIRNQYTSLEA